MLPAVTIPDPGVIVAIDVVVLVHIPPGNESVSIAVVPTHTLGGATIAGGTGLTVTIFIAGHPPTV